MIDLSIRDMMAPYISVYREAYPSSDDKQAAEGMIIRALQRGDAICFQACAAFLLMTRGWALHPPPSLLVPSSAWEDATSPLSP